MIKKKGILSIVLVCLIVILLLSTNKESQEKNIPKVKVEEKEVKVKKVRVELIPDEPEDYGMIVFKEQEKSLTQEEWNELLEDKIKKIKSETSFNTWAKLEKVIKEDPQKTKEKIKDIEKRLKEAESALKEEPSNQVVQKKIKRLRMLKAISQSLAP